MPMFTKSFTSCSRAARARLGALEMTAWICCLTRLLRSSIGTFKFSELNRGNTWTWSCWYGAVSDVVEGRTEELPVARVGNGWLDNGSESVDTFALGITPECDASPSLSISRAMSLASYAALLLTGEVRAAFIDEGDETELPAASREVPPCERDIPKLCVTNKEDPLALEEPERC